jgi:hypothetical protein
MSVDMQINLPALFTSTNRCRCHQQLKGRLNFQSCEQNIPFENLFSSRFRKAHHDEDGFEYLVSRDIYWTQL